jgi:hypothetical protein
MDLTHWFDYESNEPAHQIQFQTTLGRMRKAQKEKLCEKYNLGYSNFTFELWIILHKSNCYGSFIHRKQYIKPINSTFSENFVNLDEFKHEYNFNHGHRSHNNGCKLIETAGYKYYCENPSLCL